MNLFKKPKEISRLLSFLDTIQQVNRKDILKVYNNFYPFYGHKLPENIKSVALSSHAVHRWNERVGPRLKENELESLFNSLILTPYRIMILTKEIAVIDDEILFIYKLEEDKLIVLTIYGRLSLNPSLQCLDRLKKFNHSHYDRVDLSLPEDTLEKQTIPPVPKHMAFFKGTYHCYRLEVFMHNNESIIMLTTFFKNGKQKVAEIKPDQQKIKSKVLYLLDCLGLHSFIYKYLNHHYPKKVESIEKRDEQLEFSSESIIINHFGTSEN